MPQVAVSAQLIVYGGRQNDDLSGVLKELRDAGYDGAEIGTTFVDAPLDQVRGAFGDTGLRLSGIHGGYGQVTDPDWQDKAIEFCGQMDCGFIICSGVAPGEGIAPYIDSAQAFNAFGRKCHGSGLTFCYHNHAWEFETFEGEKGIHKLCALTDPEFVKLNVDVYWATVGGENPAEFIDRYGDRVGYYHFKDGPYTAGGSVAPGPYTFSELGKGTVDLAGALAAAARHDPQWIVYEQDSSELAPGEACRISREHLKTLGV